MAIAVWPKVFIRAIINNPVENRLMNADFNFCLHRRQRIQKIQLQFSTRGRFFCAFENSENLATLRKSFSILNI